MKDTIVMVVAEACLVPHGWHLIRNHVALNTSTPSGRAMFQVLGVFSEFERGMIRERVNADLARAKARGIKLGRKKVPAKTEDRIRQMRADKVGILKIAKTLGVGTSVVQRVVADQAA